MRRMEMSSIGFAALGRSILKNNKAQRPTAKRKISLVGETRPYQDPKQANPELLKKIKTKIVRDNKKRHQKRLIITSIAFIILMLSIFLIISNL